MKKILFISACAAVLSGCYLPCEQQRAKYAYTPAYKEVVSYTECVRPTAQPSTVVYQQIHYPELPQKQIIYVVKEQPQPEPEVEIVYEPPKKCPCAKKCCNKK